MIAESSALSPMSVWIRSRHRLPQTHRHQHKHTQPLDIVPYYEVSLPKLPLVRQLANHQASMDPAPQGPSNPADVASVGQQQTLPGGTNAEKRTGTAQHVRLLSPHTHTHIKTRTHTQTHNHFSICTICQDSAELHSTRGWSWLPTEQPLISNDCICYT